MSRTSPRRLAPALALALAAAALAAPAPASAATFTVDAATDAPDAQPGNGACATAGGACTLRAAVQETNELAGTDAIRLPAGTYGVTSRLFLEDDVRLEGAGTTDTVVDGGGSAPLLWARTAEALVCDADDDSIRQFDRHGARRGTFAGPGAGGLDLPQSAREGPDDDVHVSGFGSGVHRFDRDTGAHEGLAVPPAGPFGLLGAVDAAFAPFSHPDQDLYVANLQPGGGILRYARDTGAFLGTFVPGGSGGLNGPDTLAFAEDDLFVTSPAANAVLRYDGVSGAFERAYVGGLSRPRGLVVANGFLHVASESTDAIARFDLATGAPRSPLVPPGSGGLDRPTDLAVGPDDDLLVISAGTRQVLRYDGASGAFVGVLAQGGTSELGRPACILWRTGAGRGPTVDVSRLTLANGDATDVGNSGGALLVDRGARATLTEVLARDHAASTFGGAIRNAGELTLRHSTVRDSTLPEGGGGATSTGGGIYNQGTLELDRSLVHGNFATRGGGIANAVRVRIVNSTLSGNRASGGGGGLLNGRGSDPRAEISFSTITDNEANDLTAGGAGEADRVGGGLFNTGRVSIANTILAGNRDNRFRGQAGFSPDCHSTGPATLTSHRDNLVGVLGAACDLRDATFGDTRFDTVGTPETPLDPELGPLADNGGRVLTHEPRLGSPAVDADRFVTSATLFDCPEVDARGFPRPFDGDGDSTPRCDAGAVEQGATEDFDGVPAGVEDGAPNGGDGDEDGVPDRLQAHVASLPNAVDGRSLTLVAADGAALEDVRALPAPAGVALPTTARFPVGIVGFRVRATPAAEVRLLLPEGVEVDGYRKYGRLPGETEPGWYRFNRVEGTGARIEGRAAVLRLRDGGRGDDDATADGWVTDPGGPILVRRCAGRPATIAGTGGADVLQGSPGADVILGRGGADRIRAGGGDDTVCGGSGDDDVRGEGGADLLLGEDGDDRLDGGPGRDAADGGPGRDTIVSASPR